jgi:hypothetical protein
LLAFRHRSLLTCRRADLARSSSGELILHCIIIVIKGRDGCKSAAALPQLRLLPA